MYDEWERLKEMKEALTAWAKAYEKYSKTLYPKPRDVKLLELCRKHGLI